MPLHPADEVSAQELVLQPAPRRGGGGAFAPKWGAGAGAQQRPFEP
jgi:hypothetical protein